MDSSELAAWVAAIGTLLGVFTAVIGVWWQMQKQWLMNSATMITELADKYSSAEWRTYRAHCAELLVGMQKGSSFTLSKEFPVLGFFENIGYLTRIGVLDKTMVWNKFGWYIVRYYLALTNSVDLIAQNRADEGDDTLWSEFEWLHKEMTTIYGKKWVVINMPFLSAKRINELIEQERNARVQVG